MIRNVCIIVTLLMSQTALGQTNLIPNPSFEDTIKCPDIMISHLIDDAANWFIGRNSPDYFHECFADSFPLFDTPLNGFGYQVPHTGKAYGGIYSYGNPDGLSENYREIIYSGLLNPLQVGTKYFVKLFVSRATDGFYYSMNWATNNLGVLFTTGIYTSQDTAPLPDFSHIFTTNIISDTLNWVAISGSLVADSNYQYINIGNFFSATLTNAISIGPTPTLGAYYYVDDICVSTDSLFCETWLNFSQPNPPDVNIFPNPADNIIILSSLMPVDGTAVIIDISGRLVAEIRINQNSRLEIDVSKLCNGLYFLKIYSNQHIENIFKLIIHHKN